MLSKVLRFERQCDYPLPKQDGRRGTNGLIGYMIVSSVLFIGGRKEWQENNHPHKGRDKWDIFW